MKMNLSAALVTNDPGSESNNARIWAKGIKMKTYQEDTKSSTTDKIEGNSKIASGKLQQETGKIVRSPNLENKGDAEMFEGRVQKKVGEIKKVLGS
jgi:uncharacterized protein YjbJ (UPF0337 family)